MEEFVRVALISQQLGGLDGVSVASREVESLLSNVKVSVRRVAGRIHDPRPGDLELDCLWRTEHEGVLMPPPAPTQRDLDDVLEAAGGPGGTALIQNLGTLPTASESTVILVNHLAANDVRMVFWHHDPSWEYPDRPADPRFPLDLLGARHIADFYDQRIGLVARRSIRAAVVHPTVEPPRRLDPLEARARLGLDPTAIVLLHPVTPYPRKNIQATARFANALASHTDREVVYWLTGATSDPLDGRGAYRFASGRIADRDAMFSCASAVLLPSLWEGFGLPALEAGLAGLPLLAHTWPALEEMVDAGLDPVRINDPDAVDKLLDQITHGANHDVPRLQRSYSRGFAKELVLKALFGDDASWGRILDYQEARH